MKSKINKKNILKMLSEHKNEIKSLGVKKIGLFGSFLKGKNDKNSDMDFLVVFENPTFDKYMELKFLLERIFKRKIDLVMEDNLKSAMKYVKKEAVYA